jgi:signal transduction histidine kinase
VFVDLALFSEVLVELVRNAFKFGGPQVQVRVEMRWRNEKAVFAVSDTGPGIPPEETERVFERFYQIDGDFTGQVRGVGLGLALVKAAVEALGGVIRVQSRLQQGTRFEISF